MQVQKSKTITISHLMREITVGAIYQHYKGKKYKVLAIARYSEDPTDAFVVYQGLYECPTFGPHPIWARPYRMFAEDVVIDGVRQPRFKEVD